ncbi:MAG: twin-arginine translocase subunit TatC [Candidatus Hydrogenedentes bacterium]|nr:twin-arginine translocase subunit TatC [Candidatus Hydrogenedentota bacterium]
MNKQEQQQQEDKELRMSFTEHLAELRVRIIRSGAALLVAVVLAYIFSNQIFTIIARPLSPAGMIQNLSDLWKTEETPEAPPGPPDVVLLCRTPAEGPVTITKGDKVGLTAVYVITGPAGDNPVSGEALEGTDKNNAVVPVKVPGVVVFGETGREEGAQWTVLSPIEPILVQLKLAVYVGGLLALPIIIWQLCAFVFPGLHRGERRLVQVLLVGCSLLGIIGMLICYFLVLPLVLPYLIQWVPEGVMTQFRMSETISILLLALVGFAIAFQFPMAVLILVYLDLLTPATLKQYRKLAIVGIAFASAILTPPDPISMCIMMLPLLLLYEVSIWLSYIVIRRRKAAA